MKGVERINLLRFTFSIIFSIFLICFVSAVSVSLDASPSSLNLNYGTTSTISLSYEINNSNGYAGSFGVSILGSPKLLSYSGSSISYPENSSTSGSITINVNANVSGDFVNYISIGGESEEISIHVNSPTDCVLNPSLASYTQSVQKGSQVPLPKITFSPSNCVGTLVLDSSHVYIEGGIITGGINKPISITSIVSDGVNLEINTEGLNSQTYTSKLKISAFNKIFEIPFTIIVTGGTSPSGNWSVDNLPTCSLSSLTLDLNKTYSMACSNLQTDISIMPVVDNSYIQGTGLDTSSNQYIWYFRGKKIGYTNISACFYYLGSPVGNCFEKGVKITASGSSSLSGVDLDFVFYQDGDSLDIEDLKSMETIINVIDNETRNLVPEYKLIINGVEINNTFTFETGKNYQLRASSYGYNDRVIDFNVSAAQLTISLNPSASQYFVGDLVNITSNMENVSFYLNDELITSPYTFVGAGDFVLKATKSGYVTGEQNITIKNLISYSSLYPPDLNDWKSGKDIKVKLTEDSIWNVYFREEYKEDGNLLYKESVLFNSGIGSEVSFKIDKKGYYDIKAKKDIDSEEVVVLSKLVTGKIDFVKIWKDYWMWIVGFGIAVLGIIGLALFFNGKSPKKSEKTPMGINSGDMSADVDLGGEYD